MSDEIEAAMAQVVLELEMLSHGSVTSWNASRAGDSDSKLLADGKIRVQDAPHVYWRRRFIEAEMDTHRERAINGAKDELKRWRGHGQDPKRDLPSDAEILDARIIEAEGWSISDVAIRLRCTETRVRKVRLAKGRVPSDGTKQPTVADRLDDRARVEDLALKGLTERQIGMLTSLPKTTIRRILRRAA